jgi:HTH-type transcriptional regulator/antitoxin HigA
MQEQLLPLWRDPEGDNILPPGDYIKRELEKRGWSQADLASVLQRPLPTINEIINGKRAVTPEMAVSLGRAFNTSPDLWAHREAAYRLSLVKQSKDDDTNQKAQLYEAAPIKDLQRRGWINPEAQTASELESELVRFMGENPLSEPKVPVAVARQTFPATEFCSAQRAWLMQSTHLARRINARVYRREALEAAMPKLRKLAAKPELAAKVPILLAELGVRLVVVEDLPHTQIDGAAFFLENETSKPVVVLSLRIDRMESFWHTLGHELRHIINCDPVSLDADLFGENREKQLKQMEVKANLEASDWLIPQAEIKSFVLRARPWFAKESILPFAIRMGVHPCIVIGYLQHSDVIGWDRHADVRPKIREHILATATCDGYGKRNT